jgi:hypothetical protein
MGLDQICLRSDHMKDNPKKLGESREKREKERRLDEALEESFPASDPLPTTRTTVGAPDDHPEKTHERLPAKKG